MNKIYLSLIAVLMNAAAFAQTLCSNGRYSGNVYTTISSTLDIPFGASKQFSGTTATLTLNFYEPANDTAAKRPLIIWAHGGSFIGGTKDDQDVTELCKRFTKKGYICASINYRVGFFPFDSTGIVPALLRAVQDMKASIRFFYKDRLTTNKYKVDTANIFIGGSSAGAITALHAAYLNKTCEINPYINQTALTAAGGIEGASGNQCYSSKVKGVINLCGALGKYWWIESGDVPLCSMHGTNDGTVKYGQGKANPGFPTLYMDGSRMIQAGIGSSGVNHSFYTWYNADHVPYAGTTANSIAYMDTTEKFVRDYLVARLACTDPILLAPNTPSGTVTAYTFTACNTNVPMACNVGIAETENTTLLDELYPNPSSGFVTVVFKNQGDDHTLILMDMTGKIIQLENTKEQTYTIHKNNLAPGIYFLKAINQRGEYSVKKIMFY
jgi:alpha/beta superfamily hydrolase